MSSSNESGERELADIFKRYGEERYARQIARAIVRRRRSSSRSSAPADLVEVIKSAIPAPARFGEGHPAKRVFQALRIEVNDELGALERALPAALEMLRPGGRLAVISFHSLEDRIVKQFLRKQEHGCTCPPDFPVCVCGSEPTHARDAAPRDPADGRPRSLATRAPSPPASASGRRSRDGEPDARPGLGDRRAGRPPAAARPSRASRKRAQARTRGGILWIAVSGILLAGVVFVNVAVLQLNLALDTTNAERSKLLAENAALQSQLLVARRLARDPATRRSGSSGSSTRIPRRVRQPRGSDAPTSRQTAGSACCS